MATSPNAKVNITADTSQFDRGIKAAKAEMKDFGKVSDSVSSAFGKALGINTDQVERLSNAAREMGNRLAESGAEGTSALGKLLSSISSLQVGLASLGIAGVVAGFKALNAEAENFKSTIAGANIELQTTAYIDTFKQAMHDMNAGTGEAVAEAQSKWQKWWATLPERMAAKTAVAPGGTATVPMTPVTPQQVQLSQQINETIDEAVGKAERASDIAGELYNIGRLQSDNTREIARLSADIAEQQLIARDNTYSIAERSDAIAKAEELIRQKYALQLPLEQRKSELMDEQAGLVSSTPAQIDAANQQSVRAIALEKQQADELRTLTRLRNSLNSQQNTMNAALQKQLELQRQIAQSRADLAALDLSVSGSPTSKAVSQIPVSLAPRQTVADFQEILNTHFGNSLFLSIGVSLDKGTLIDLTREVESVISQLSESVGESLGGLIGDLVTGGDAFGNFANAAISAFADMATTVGKMAIATGVASLGIKAALESLNGYAAIAAGIALVALGAAVKSGLSNVASGNYSASTAVATGSYTSGMNDYETREINVNVTGTLKASGSELEAVLNNTNNMKGYTT